MHRERQTTPRRSFIATCLLAGMAGKVFSAEITFANAGMKPPQAIVFPDAGDIPNSRSPLLVYAGAVPADADAIETLFRRNGWQPAWRYGVYPFPHYHSTAHEVLGVYRGSARIRLGHSAGRVFEVKAGDVIVIPAGVGHENLGASEDFHVVGGYPPDQRADLLRGREGERPAADERIAQLAQPVTDPVYGAGGPLVALWTSAEKTPSDATPPPRNLPRPGQ